MFINPRVNKAYLQNSCRICLKLQHDPFESDHTFIDKSIQKVFYEITTQKLPLATHLPFKICQTCRNNLRSAHLFRAALTQVQTQLNSLIDTSMLKQKNEAIVDYLKELFIIQNANIACPKTTPENQVTVVLDIFTHSEELPVEDSKEEIVNRTADTIVQAYYSEESDVELKDDPLEQLNQLQSKYKPTKTNEEPYKVIDQMAIQDITFDESDGEEVVTGKCDPLEQLNQPTAPKNLLIPTDWNLKDNDEYYTTADNERKAYKNFSPKAAALVAKRQPLFKPVILKQCPRCNLKKATEYHISLHDPMPVPCPHCKKVYSDQFRLASHKSKCAKNKIEFSCETCGKIIIGQINFQNHTNGHLPNEQRRFGCDQCDKRFNHATHLKNHKLSHNPAVRAHLCHLCASTFRLKYTLRCHLLKNHADSLSERELPQLKCDCCDRLFSNDAALKVHLTRMKSRDYKGPTNKPKTNRSNTPSKPRKKRITGRPVRHCTPPRIHKCEYCQLLLPSAEAFRKHRMLHKFNCNVCHRIYVDIDKFRKHKLKHDSEPEHLRNLHCPEPGCTAKFRKPYCLQMHKMKHSNEFPHPCADCTMVFRSSSEMNKHRVRKHKQTDSSVLLPEVSSTLVLGAQVEEIPVTDEISTICYEGKLLLEQLDPVPVTEN